MAAITKCAHPDCERKLGMMTKVIGRKSNQKKFCSPACKKAYLNNNGRLSWLRWSSNATTTDVTQSDTRG